ncbi:hypothetical protein BKK49_12320 [Rodentibacter rarus]|uniref:hypothetical protein n=1 Tax=Rodentibacter rarus TaxID=1908260 RepID=UPI00098535CD|nr:hypothetical protein [Rodentibacter rarus]OOF35674.1 hypothetical protein BKK49_12320 [Rodentibacter rarus]
MGKNKKPRMKRNHSGLITPPKAESMQDNFSNFPVIGKLLTQLNIGENMSTQGADEAGKDISDGFKFFLKAVGAGAFIALICWQAPNLAAALIQLITAIKQ